MKIKKLFTALRYILAVTFIIISVVGSFGWKNFDKDTESLLNNPNGIVVDEVGRIYCGINYSRINIYDKNGHFIRSIRINSDGGDFKMKIEQNYLNVTTVRNKMVFVYDEDGKLVRQEMRKETNDTFQQLSENQFTDKNANVFKIKTPLFLYPYIVKETPSGQRTTLVSVPFSKWIFMSPYPSWHFGFIGLLLIVVDLNKVRKYFMAVDEK